MIWHHDKIKDHDRESIKARHDVIINVAVDVAVNVAVVVSWWKSEEHKSEIAWEKSSLYTQIWSVCLLIFSTHLSEAIQHQQRLKTQSS